MLTLTAKVINVFPTAQFTDKQTGEVTKAGHKVQLQYKEPVKGGGERVVVKDMNVKSMGEVWNKIVGKTVHVGVAIYVNGNKADLYIPEGTAPTVAAGQA